MKEIIEAAFRGAAVELEIAKAVVHGARNAGLSMDEGECGPVASSFDLEALEVWCNAMAKVNPDALNIACRRESD